MTEPDEHPGPDLAEPDLAEPLAEAPKPPEPSNPRVAAALARLDELAGTDPAGHVEIYERVHRELQDALAEAADDNQPPAHADPDAADP